MTPPPPVSVCVPAWNEERGIGPALESVARQDYRGDIEILVGLNGCTDGTAEVVRRFARGRPARLLDLPERGKPGAWNHLVEAATHDRLVFMDGDVRLAPGAVGALVRRLAADRGLLAVGGLALPAGEGLDPLTRILNPAPADLGCLVGRLYAFSRPAMLSAMAARGYARMPVDVIHEDAWLTAVAGRGRWATEPSAIVRYRPTHWSELLGIERRCVRAERQLTGKYGRLLAGERDEALFLFESRAARWSRRRARWRTPGAPGGRAGVILNFLAKRLIRRIAELQVNRETPRSGAAAFERARSTRTGPLQSTER
jgi:glycosyltransferase involved in cell wall biosynthesis